MEVSNYKLTEKFVILLSFPCFLTLDFYLLWSNMSLNINLNVYSFAWKRKKKKRERKKERKSSLYQISQTVKSTIVSSNKRSTVSSVTKFLSLNLCEENTFIINILLSIWMGPKQHFKEIKYVTQ